MTISAVVASARTVEDVGVVLGRQPIELPDVEQIIELAVHVSTGRDVCIGRYTDIDQ